MRRERAATQELVEAGPEPGADGAPILYRPQPHLRSPLVEPRPLEPQRHRLGPGAATLPLPSARAVVRPVAWAVLVGVPLVVLIGWQVAAVLSALAALTHELDARFRHANTSFAEGFLPFRDRSGWPQGIQEEYDVHWNWPSRSRDRHASRP